MTVLGICCLFGCLYVSLSVCVCCVCVFICLSVWLVSLSMRFPVSDCHALSLRDHGLVPSLGAPNHRRPQELASLAPDQARVVRHEGNCSHSWRTMCDCRTDTICAVCGCPQTEIFIQGVPRSLLDKTAPRFSTVDCCRGDDVEEFPVCPCAAAAPQYQACLAIWSETSISRFRGGIDRHFYRRRGLLYVIWCLRQDIRCSWHDQFPPK